MLLVDPAVGLRWETRDGPLCGSTERTLCCHDYGVLSPIGPKHPSIPAQGGVAKNKDGQTEGREKGKAVEQKREPHIIKILKKERNRVTDPRLMQRNVKH